MCNCLEAEVVVSAFARLLRFEAFPSSVESRPACPVLRTKISKDCSPFLLIGRRVEISFALRVTGDSMKDAGVLEADYVIVHKQAVAASGEIVVATIDGETTLKRLIMRGAQTFLVPENSTYEAIKVRTESALIHGVIVGLLRAYRRDHAWMDPAD